MWFFWDTFLSSWRPLSKTPPQVGGRIRSLWAQWPSVVCSRFARWASSRTRRVRNFRRSHLESARYLPFVVVKRRGGYSIEESPPGGEVVSVHFRVVRLVQLIISHSWSTCKLLLVYKLGSKVPNLNRLVDHFSIDIDIDRANMIDYIIVDNRGI